MNEYHDVRSPDEIRLDQPAVIEASAGTGKTYTIERLVLRLVRDEGVDVDRLLVVTFTEKAAGELKERIRTRLEEAVHVCTDDLEQRARLRRAVDNFDSAGIYTIHGFCHQVLQNYGFELGRSFEYEVVDDGPLLEHLLKQQMRAEWPRRYGEDLEAVLHLSGYPDIDRNGESRFENTVRRIAANFRPEYESILPPPDENDSPAWLERFRDLEAFVQEKLAALVDLAGPVDGRVPERSALVAGFEALNQKKNSRNKKVRKILLPLLELLGDFREGSLPALALWREFLKTCRPALDDPEDIGFRVLSERHWTAAGENLTACPELPEIVAVLEELRIAAGGTEVDAVARGLAADSIASLGRDLARYKAEHGLVSFQDMIELVDRALPGDGMLLQALRERYRYAIVDEFQDTDAVQWSIFRKLYIEESYGPVRGVLMIVGDPKQAIYGFRGADVHAYFGARALIESLAAEGRAGLYRLGVNFRSSPALVHVFNRLFADPAYFGQDVGIRYAELAAAGEETRRLRAKRDDSARPAVQFVDLDEAGSGTSARRCFAEFVAQEVSEIILSGKIEIERDGAVRPLDFGDVCVLVRGRGDVEAVEAAFDHRRVPHTFYKKPGLYDSIEAYEIALLLAAVERPADAARFRKVLLSRFFRLRPDELRNVDSNLEEGPARELLLRLREYAGRRAWPQFFRRLMQESLGLAPYADGPDPAWERRLVNYEQIMDDLLEAASRRSLDLTGLLEHLHALRGGNASGFSIEDEQDIHREESEAPRVRIMTIHAAKGLEFPVVFVAGGLTQIAHYQREYFEYHDENGTKVYDLLKSDVQRQADEADAEDRRLFYVAFTRASLKLYVPYYRASGAGRTSAGPVARFVRDAVDQSGLGQSEDAGFVPGTKRRTAIIGPEVTASTLTSKENKLITESFPAPPRDAAGRRVDLVSYTTLVRGAARHRERLLQFGEPVAAGDENVLFAAAPQVARGLDEDAAVNSAGDVLPRGPEAGVMFHDLLEHVDYADYARSGGTGMLPRPDDLSTENRELIVERLRRFGDPDPEHGLLSPVHAVLARTLTASLEPAGGLRLCDLRPVDRIHEMEFYFHVPRLRTSPPLESTELNVIDGYVWGFIDLVFRHEGRYYLADWKSNDLENGDYDAPALQQAMEHHDYHLQARIYGHALLLWLEQTVPDFHYERDFGGVFYFFLRGMDPGRPGRGVYFVRPEERELLALTEELPAYV